MLETMNLMSVVLTLALVLVGGPVIFRRHGYPWNKVIFGTAVVLLVVLALVAMLATVQIKAGLSLPLILLVPPVVVIGGLVGQKHMHRFFADDTTG